MRNPLLFLPFNVALRFTHTGKYLLTYLLSYLTSHEFSNFSSTVGHIVMKSYRKGSFNTDALRCGVVRCRTTTYGTAMHTTHTTVTYLV